MQYLYEDGDLYNFMNVENYEQLALNKDIIGDALKFVTEYPGRSFLLWRVVTTLTRKSQTALSSSLVGVKSVTALAS